MVKKQRDGKMMNPTDAHRKMERRKELQRVSSMTPLVVQRFSFLFSYAASRRIIAAWGLSGDHNDALLAGLGLVILGLLLPPHCVDSSIVPLLLYHCLIYFVDSFVNMAVHFRRCYWTIYPSCVRPDGNHRLV